MMHQLSLSYFPKSSPCFLVLKSKQSIQNGDISTARVSWMGRARAGSGESIDPRPKSFCIWGPVDITCNMAADSSYFNHQCQETIKYSSTFARYWRKSFMEFQSSNENTWRFVLLSKCLCGYWSQKFGNLSISNGQLRLQLRIGMYIPPNQTHIAHFGMDPTTSPWACVTWNGMNG